MIHEGTEEKTIRQHIFFDLNIGMLIYAVTQSLSTRHAGDLNA